MGFQQLREIKAFVKREMLLNSFVMKTVLITFWMDGEKTDFRLFTHLLRLKYVPLCFDRALSFPTKYQQG